MKLKPRTGEIRRFSGDPVQHRFLVSFFKRGVRGAAALRLFLSKYAFHDALVKLVPFVIFAISLRKGDNPQKCRGGGACLLASS